MQMNVSLFERVAKLTPDELVADIKNAPLEVKLQILAILSANRLFNVTPWLSYPLLLLYYLIPKWFIYTAVYDFYAKNPVYITIRFNYWLEYLLYGKKRSRKYQQVYYIIIGTLLTTGWEPPSEEQ